MTMNITDKSLEVFASYAEDAINWDGEPLLGGDAAERGNITQLKRAGLIATFEDGGCTWIQFTEDGKALAESMGIDLGVEL